MSTPDPDHRSEREPERGESIPCPPGSDLTAWARGELSPSRAREVDWHLQTCTRCRRLAGETADLLRLLRRESEGGALRPPVPVPGFARRVARGASGGSGRRSPPTRGRRVEIALSLALLVAAVVSVAVSLGPERAAAPHRPVEADPGAAVDVPGAIERSRAWLVETQEPDGSWPPERWGGSRWYRVGLTALTLVTIQTTGQGPEPFHDHCERARAYLHGQQDADGLFGPKFRGALYNHSLATIALLDSPGGAPGPATCSRRPCAAVERAVGYIVTQQTADGGWGYLAERGDPLENESIGLWALRALLAARENGIPDLDGPIAGAARWLRSRLPAHGEPHGRLASHAPMPYDATIVSSASLALSALLVSPEGLASDARRQIDSVLRSLGRREEPPALYDRLLIVDALSRLSGRTPSATRSRLENELLSVQVREGENRGSWDPCDRWGPLGGRIYATAVATLAIDIGHRTRERQDSRLTDRRM